RRDVLAGRVDGEDAALLARTFGVAVQVGGRELVWRPAGGRGPGRDRCGRWLRGSVRHGGPSAIGTATGSGIVAVTGPVPVRPAGALQPSSTSGSPRASAASTSSSGRSRVSPSTKRRLPTVPMSTSGTSASAHSWAKARTAVEDTLTTT